MALLRLRRAPDCSHFRGNDGGWRGRRGVLAFRLQRITALSRRRAAPTLSFDNNVGDPGQGKIGVMTTRNEHPTRVRSLEAALEVVRAEGIGELTTRAIARRSGLTQPAIYRHF